MRFRLSTALTVAAGLIAGLASPATLAGAQAARASVPSAIAGPVAKVASSSDAATADGNGTCEAITLPVALGPGQLATQWIAATYCTPDTWAPGPAAVDVMTPGATYNSLYWNWPVGPALYSYVDKTLQAGRATLDYDRVGTGASSHPPALALDINAEAYVLHQIVTWLHASLRYDLVNLIGHSLGSVISIQEAGIYQDVSAVVVTGLLHAPGVGAGFATTLASLMYPAAFDPQIEVSGLRSVGYLTTEPGDRAADFYSYSADQAVVSYDEAHKDVVPATDLATLATTWALPPGPNASDSINVPVLVVIGAQDAIFCADPPVLDCGRPGQVLATERPYYASAPSLSLDVIPDTGHDVALHPSAGESFALISQWIEQH